MKVVVVKLTSESKVSHTGPPTWPRHASHCWLPGSPRFIKLQTMPVLRTLSKFVETHCHKSARKCPIYSFFSLLMQVATQRDFVGVQGITFDFTSMGEVLAEKHTSSLNLRFFLGTNTSRLAVFTFTISKRTILHIWTHEWATNTTTTSTPLLTGHDAHSTLYLHIWGDTTAGIKVPNTHPLKWAGMKPGHRARRK